MICIDLIDKNEEQILRDVTKRIADMKFLRLRMPQKIALDAQM